MDLNAPSPAEARAGSGDLAVRLTFDDGGIFPETPAIDAFTGTTPLMVVSVQYGVHDRAFIQGVTVRLPAALLASVGTIPLHVSVTGVGVSNVVDLSVVDADNAVPVLSSVSANSTAIAEAGASGLSVTVTGSGFLSGAYVEMNGYTFFPSTTSDTEIALTLNSFAQEVAGAHELRVVNPTPGGGASNAVTFTVTGDNPAPTIASTSLGSVGAGTSTVGITFTGTGYQSATTFDVTLPNADVISVPGFRGSSTSFTGTLPTEVLASAGTLTLSLTNPAPGGGTATTTFDVVAGNPTPQLTSVRPTQFDLGVSGQLVTLSGNGFVSVSQVNEQGSSTSLPITSVTPTSIVATLPDSLVATAGTLTLEVVNPGPGGGTSASRSVTVVAIPQITSLSPSTVAIGSSPSIVISGVDLPSTGFPIVRLTDQAILNRVFTLAGFGGNGNGQIVEIGPTQWSITLNGASDLMAVAADFDVTVSAEGSPTSTAATLTVE